MSEDFANDSSPNALEAYKPPSSELKKAMGGKRWLIGFVVLCGLGIAGFAAISFIWVTPSFDVTSRQPPIRPKFPTQNKTTIEQESSADAP